MVDSIDNLLTSPWRSVVVLLAVRLKIFTILADKKMAIEELADRCQVIPHLLKFLLDACTSLGLLHSQNDRYANTQFSKEYLREGNSHYVGDLIQLQFHELPKWTSLYEIFKGKDPVEEKTLDKKQLHRTFIKAMHNLGLLGEAEALKNAVDLSGCKRLVDVGGGSGIYSVFLCRKFPELHANILDKRETLAITNQIISLYEESKRIILREADIIKDSYGLSVDAVLLSDVIYDETEALSILERARECLCRNGILMIRGYYFNSERSGPIWGSLFALGQLAFDPRRNILTVSELENIVCRFGFTLIKSAPLTERSYLLTYRKD